jgi:hypothetical protein
LFGLTAGFQQWNPVFLIFLFCLAANRSKAPPRNRTVLPILEHEGTPSGTNKKAGHEDRLVTEAEDGRSIQQTRLNETRKAAQHADQSDGGQKIRLRGMHRVSKANGAGVFVITGPGEVLGVRIHAR